GALAKTLVYGDWKGIDYVRQYVIPANPKTADQQEQRGFFTAAIEAWHVDGYTEDDVTAWNLYALAQKIAASGFNMFVKLKVLASVAVKTWGALKDCLIASITSLGCIKNRHSLRLKRCIWRFRFFGPSPGNWCYAS
ncbi:unnamed protein product, partial [marine sediment metagenome]